MTRVRHVVRECSSPGCAFRFPVCAPEGEVLAGEVCPRCGAATVIRSRWETNLETQMPAERRVDVYRRALLDNLRSAWNVGSIVRTADGLGFERLHVCGQTPPLTHPRVGKTGLGAEKTMAWEQHTNAVQAAQVLLAQGWRLWALEEHPRAEPLTRAQRFPAGQAVALIVGNEQSGVDPALLALCERVYSLPMLGVKRSINVAVAFGMAAYLLAAD